MIKTECELGAIIYSNDKNDDIILNTIKESIQEGLEPRKLEFCIDWNFIYPLVEHLYDDLGRPGIDPVVLFK